MKGNEKDTFKGTICEIFTVLTHKMTPIFYHELRKQVEVLTLTIILGETSETTASPDFKKNLCVCGTILPLGGAIFPHSS